MNKYKELTMQQTSLAFHRLINEFELGLKHQMLLKTPLMVNAIALKSIEKYADRTEYPIEMTKIIERRDCEYYLEELNKIANRFDVLEGQIRQQLGLYFNNESEG